MRRRPRSAIPAIHLLALSFLVAFLFALAASSGTASAYTVVTASHDVHVDCGASGTDVPTDWYFPQPNPNLGLIWVQHGFSRTNNQYVDLATHLAEQGYVVFATSLAPGGTGCAMNNPGFLSDFARLFPDLANPAVGLLASAQAAATTAGVSLPALPVKFAFTGHSAGGPSIAAVAKNLVVSFPATASHLSGLLFLDPVESTSDSLMATALPALTAIEYYTISSPPYSCNSSASGTALLEAQPRPFVGVRLTSGSHCDAEGSSTNFLCTGFCGTSQAENVAILQDLAAGWMTDLFAESFTSGWYPSGMYFEGKVAAGRIVALPAPSSCGNGTVNAGEVCDDGNRANGDCCNAICGAEIAGATCPADGNPCTNDVCSAGGTCGVANTAACDDGQFCNGADTCAAGVCTQHAGDPCAAGAECNRTCQEASDTCFATAGTVCGDDGNVCTSDACDGAGTCAHPAGNAGTACRAAAGTCDVAETCSGVSPSCPADSLVSVGVVCRAPAGACDLVETCSGASAACPSDLLAATGTLCRGGADVCDVAETCSGSSATCPGDGFVVAGTACRAAAGACDQAEACTGGGASCPADVLMPIGAVCRTAAGTCDLAESCTGASPACPVDSLRPAGFVCRGAAGLCDVAETCSGAAAACPADGLQPAGTVCRIAAGVCDVAEICGGASAACPGDGFRPASAICRAAGGECDVAESCSGSAAGCPTDGFVPAGVACSDDSLPCTADACDGAGTCAHPAGQVGVICRASTDPCDLAEACDGASTSCPVDAPPSDGDGDGECDSKDPCTNLADGRDFLIKPKPVVRLSRIGVDPVTGDDRIALSGAFSLPAGRSFVELVPHARGMRIVVESANGPRRADLVLPGGLYQGAGTAGWSQNGTGTAWIWRDARSLVPSGISKLVLTDRSRSAPGRVQIKISGKTANLPVVAGDEPIQVVVTLGGAIDAIAGLCGETAFGAGQCRFAASGAALTCRP